MSSTRIPFAQVFKTQPDNLSQRVALNEDEMDPADFVPRDVSAPSLRGGGAGSLQGGAGGGTSFQGGGGINRSNTQPTQVFRGTRTPQMLEFERQAEERAREQEAMQEERDRMMETEAKIQRDKERIEQEEYEMRQYYEAEALKHADELRYHQEEVRKHQDRVRAHERMLLDHEASSEAFAKVIAMPVTAGGRRQMPAYYRMPRVGGGSISSLGSRSGSRAGSIDGYGTGT